MISEKMKKLLQNNSVVREMFEEGKRLMSMILVLEIQVFQLQVKLMKQ